MNIVLNVAEKPSVARGITDLLSQGRKRTVCRSYMIP